MNVNDVPAPHVRAVLQRLMEVFAPGGPDDNRQARGTIQHMLNNLPGGVVRQMLDHAIPQPTMAELLGVGNSDESRSNLEWGLRGCENDLAVIDLIEEVRALRKGAAVSYASPMDDPVRRLLLLSLPEARAKVLSSMATIRKVIAQKSLPSQGNAEAVGKAIAAERDEIAQVGFPIFPTSASPDGYGKCEVCGKPVYPPTNCYMAGAYVFNNKAWHGDCFPRSGISGTTQCL